MRVAFLSPGFQRGGAERWIISLCRWLPSQIVGVVSTTSQVDEGQRRELSRLAVDVTSWEEDAVAAQHVLRAADVVIAWGIGRQMAAYVKGLTVPVVWVSHGGCEWTARLALEAVGAVSHWVSVSERARRVYLQDIQTTATVIHNGVDVERTTPIHGRQRARAALGLQEHQIAVGYMGRFSPEKRPAAVAEAVACLPDHYVAVMAGDGWKDAETRAEALAAAPGRVIFAGHHSHVGDLLAAFDYWLNASPSEGMCLSLIEAWLAGVPCVSTRTGAIPELEREYGRLVYPLPIGADGQAIAKALLRCPSRQALAQLTPAARELAWGRLTAAAMAARWSDYLQSIVSIPR